MKVDWCRRIVGQLSPAHGLEIQAPRVSEDFVSVVSTNNIYNYEDKETVTNKQYVTRHARLHLSFCTALWHRLAAGNCSDALSSMGRVKSGTVLVSIHVCVLKSNVGRNSKP